MYDVTTRTCGFAARALWLNASKLVFTGWQFGSTDAADDAGLCQQASEHASEIRRFPEREADAGNAPQAANVDKSQRTGDNKTRKQLALKGLVLG